MSFAQNPIQLRERKLLWIVLMLALEAFVATPKAVRAQAGSYDQQYVPISPQVLKKKLLLSSRDPVRMYDLIRQADTQNQTNLAFSTLNQLRLKQPNNAVVLASFCFAARIAAGDYSNPGEQKRGLSPSEEVDYANALLKAYSLDPKLWLTYAVQGHNLRTDPLESEKCFRLLKTAVRLAPDISYTHTLLGEFYMLYAPQHKYYEKAVQELVTAKNLQPVSSHTADLLFIIYDTLMPRREEAKEAKQYLLSTLPPDYKFSPTFKARLAKY